MYQEFTTYFDKRIDLPQELEKEFSIKDIFLIKRSAILCTIKKKQSLSESLYVLKIIPKNQYQKQIYETLPHLKAGSILTAVQEYHTKHFIYFIYPRLQSLSYLVRAGKMDLPSIRMYLEDIGDTIISLHKSNIFHMDITPGNIYRDSDGHFLLGDFSSAYRKGSLLKNRSPTGSTKGFYPESISPYKAPENYDIYGFYKILYLMLNRKEQASGKDLEEINLFLTGTLEQCSKSPLSDRFFEKNLDQAKTLFSKIKEEQIYRYWKSITTDVWQASFELYTEPEPFCSFPSFIKPSFENIFKLPSIPKSFLSKDFFTKRAALYGLLIICGFLFLFSCYHYLSGKYRTPARPALPVQNTVNSGSSPSDTPFPESTSHKETVSPKPVEQKDTATSDPVRENSFSIAGKNLQDAKFLSEIRQTDQITVLFAQKNKFFNVSSFLNFINLKELYLNQNNITSLRGIEHLKTLEVLDLSENALEDISGLSSLKKLEILDLSGQKNLKHLKTLKKLTRLKYLIITNSNISEEEVHYLNQHLPNCMIIY